MTRIFTPDECRTASGRKPGNALSTPRGAAAEPDLATLILTLLSVAEDDRTLSTSLSMVRAENSREDFTTGMREAARRIGMLLGAAERLEATERLSANRMPV